MTTRTRTGEPQADTALEREFRRLHERWKNDTAGFSMANRILAHPAYERIIEMGEAVLPLILEDLRDGGGHWYRALREITGENPVPPEDRGWSSKMRAAWIAWGVGAGYIK